MPMVHLHAFRSAGNFARADYATVVETLTAVVGRDIMYGEAANPIRGAVGLELWEPTDATEWVIYEVGGDAITWWPLAPGAGHSWSFRRLPHLEQPGGGILLDVSRGEPGPLVIDLVTAALSSSSVLVREYAIELLRFLP